MATDAEMIKCSPAAEERRLQNEAFLNAIMNCDDETFEKVISILTAKELLPV